MKVSFSLARKMMQIAIFREIELQYSRIFSEYDIYLGWSVLGSIYMNMNNAFVQKFREINLRLEMNYKENWFHEIFLRRLKTVS